MTIALKWQVILWGGEAYIYLYTLQIISFFLAQTVSVQVGPYNMLQFNIYV